MKARVDNVRLVDMLSLLARLSLYVDAVDVIVDTEMEMPCMCGCGNWFDLAEDFHH